MKDLVGISEGDAFSLLLLSDGSVYSFGENENDELGLGESEPQSVHLPKLIPSLTSVKQIAAGLSHGVALTTDGSVYAWGKNNFGQVSLMIEGNVKTPYLIQPLKNIKSVSAAIGYTVALDTYGSVWQWGSNSSKAKAPLKKLDGLQNIVWVGATDPFSLALNDQGELYWWTSPTSYTQSATAPPLPAKYPIDKKIIEVSAGVNHALFKTVDGTLYGFGENYAFQLGALTSTWGELWNPNIPIIMNIGKLSSVKSFIAGRDFSAILTKTNRFYLLGTTYLPNSQQESSVYRTPTLISAKNKNFLNLLFTSSATLPPSPQFIEITWRKLKALEIAL